ncbi:MAG: hypothetical protein FWG66_06225, partial [Spirochaetes bacterium]|nr:hypothetical protein [Spirochaetota bacterium]
MRAKARRAAALFGGWRRKRGILKALPYAPWLPLFLACTSNSTFTLFNYHSPSNFSRKEAKIAKIGAELIN